MNKKGEVFDLARKMVFWMIAGVIITAITLTYAIVLASYHNNLTIVPQELSAELISLRFTNNPECFAYQDENGVVYASSIDLNKFTTLRMNSCYLTDQQLGNKDMNFELILQETGTRLQTNNYFQKIDSVINRQVQLWDGSQLSTATLRINVQETT